jgi:hypothetical protein
MDCNKPLYPYFSISALMKSRNCNKGHHFPDIVYLELTRISNTPPAENIFLEKVDVEDQANH